MGGIPGRLNKLNTMQPSKLTHIKYTQESGLPEAWIDVQGKLLSSSIPSISDCVEVGIGNSVSSIGAYAFKNCISLSNVIIPSSVMQIENFAFGACYSLSNVEIPSSVTQLGARMFRNCAMLQNVKVDGDVTEVGLQSFSYCSSLATIDFTNNTTVPALDYSSAFSYTNDTYKVIVPGNLFD